MGCWDNNHLEMLLLPLLLLVGGGVATQTNNNPHPPIEDMAFSIGGQKNEGMKRNTEKDDGRTPRTLIVGGQPSDQKRFPYFASMHQRFATRGGACAGSLITPDMIISAAHCYNPAHLFEPVFAINNTRHFVGADDEFTHVRRTQERFSHPFYDRQTFRNDIMIILLDRPILDEGIQPVQLNLDHSNLPYVDQTTTAVGLGLLMEGLPERPLVFHSVDVDIVSHSVCDSRYPHRLIDAIQFCAGNYGRDTCQGDSGGPLVIKGSSPDKDLLVGITSSGAGCGRNPGIYTRVSYFREWIMTIVCARSAFPFDACRNHTLTFSIPPPPTPLSFRANYVARFQYLLDPGCFGYPPTIEAYCRGRINILGTSDNTIECSSLEPTSFGFNGFKCTNRCIEERTCNNVYLTNERRSEDGVWGEVYYSCESNLVDNLKTYYYVESGGKPEARCDGTQVLGNGRNFKVGQLGIYCFDPREFSGGFYNFPDYSFECGADDLNGLFGSKYTCYSGRNCEADECSFEFDPVRIDSDTFRLGCIQSLDGSPVDPSSPIIQERDSGTYTAQFRGDWQLDLGFSCFGGFAKVTITCTNGKIRYLNQLDRSTECVRITDSTIECQERESSAFVNEYNGLVYECTAENQLPLTELTYHNATTSCEDVSERRITRHKTQLGVLCDGYVWDDYYFECEAGDLYQYEFTQVYTCFEGVEVTNTTRSYFVGQTRIFTDYRWSNNAADSCFDFVPPTE